MTPLELATLTLGPFSTCISFFLWSLVQDPHLIIKELNVQPKVRPMTTFGDYACAGVDMLCRLHPLFD